MIYSWNPKSKKLYIPEAQVTVPSIESFDAAKAFVNADGFDPMNWKYIIKSKNGKIYNFAVLSDALSAAQEKSTTRVSYSVYENGKAIAGFLNKKRLTDWVTVFKKEADESSYRARPSKKEWYYSIPRETYCEDKWLLSTTIDTAPGKVRICKTYMWYVKCKNGHLSTKFTKASKVFHQNGAVYYYSEGKMQHMQAKDISLYLDEDELTALRTELTKLRPELRQILMTTPYYNLIGVFSRPTAYYCFDTFHKKAWERKNGRLYYGYYPKEVVDESKMIDVLAKRMRVPMTKGLRKLYNENPHNMDVVKFLKESGFKDTNSYQKLTGMGVHFCLHNPAKFSPFFKRMIQLRGENNVARMASDTDFDLLKDVVQSYMTVDEDAADFIMKNARNFEEIHDTFNTSCPTKERYVDQKIRYTDKEKKRYNYICKDGIRFELADGSKELAIIGAQMGICVGGYADGALKKYTTIVKMMDGDKYAACIEVKKSSVVQIKAKFNNPVKGEYKHNIDEWLEHGKIECKCYDYSNIGRTWYSDHNYAHIRPADFEPAGHRGVLQIEKRKHVHFKHNNSWFFKSQLEYDRMERIYEMAIDPEEERRAEEQFHNETVEFQAIDPDELPF